MTSQALMETTNLKVRGRPADERGVIIRTSRIMGLMLAIVLAAVLSVAVAKPAQTAQLRGVQLHSLWADVTDSEMTHELDLAREAGANVVRVDVSWSSLETEGPGRRSAWYERKLKRFFAAAAQRKIKVIAMLWSTPCWASSAPQSLRDGCKGKWWDRGVDRYLPRNPARYAAMARWLTSRYGRRLAALEVWNEPNHADALRGPAPARSYARLLRATYRAAKAGDRRVPVVTGGLSMADAGFLRELYRAGIKGHYDGIGLHPYNEWRAPDDSWKKRWVRYTFLPGIELIRATQRRNGDRAPLWVTEFGWPSCQPRGTDRWCVTREQQATYIARAIDLLRGRPYVRAGVVYNLRAVGEDPADRESSYGLVERDFTPKPAYWALRSALTAR